MFLGTLWGLDLTLVRQTVSRLITLKIIPPLQWYRYAGGKHHRRRVPCTSQHRTADRVDQLRYILAVSLYHDPHIQFRSREPLRPRQNNELHKKIDALRNKSSAIVTEVGNYVCLSVRLSVWDARAPRPNDRAFRQSDNICSTTYVLICSTTYNFWS